MKPILTICAVLAGPVIMPITYAQEPADRPTARYRITDLGTLQGCDVTYAVAVNDSGLVAGYAYPFAPPGHGNSVLSRPFIWRNGTITELQKLGGRHGQALAVNSRGDVAGYADLPDSDHRPVVWRKAQGYVPKAVSTRSGRVMALTDDGVAAGHVNEFDPTKTRAMRAALWQEGREELVGLGGDAENVILAIGPEAAMVGFSVPPGRSRASSMFEGDNHAAIWRAGKQELLPELDGDRPIEPGFSGRRLSECSSINDAGVAVGWCDTTKGRVACMWRDGKVSALPQLPGYRSEAHSINKRGAIVGEALEKASRPGWKWVACIWEDGKVQDLNDLIPVNSGWKLSVAKCISDTGLIVGYGSCDQYPSHHWRAFLLTPVKPR